MAVARRLVSAVATMRGLALEGGVASVSRGHDSREWVP